MIQHEHLNQWDWLIPAGLLGLSFIPVVAGTVRLVQLGSVAPITLENARFFAAPLPVVLHILSAILFSVLGALQFSTTLRQRSPKWHRVSGRIVVLTGIFVALSGLWMTVVYFIPPELQGGLLYGARVFVSVSMLFSIYWAVAAVMRRDIAMHRAWMIRAYALGQGAGMQVVVLLPWMLLIGMPSIWQRDVLMSAAWVINLLVAELVIHRWPQRGLIYYRRIF